MDLKDAIKPASSDSLAKNAAAVSYVRNLASLFAGVAAGTLRLESLLGFAFYFAACVATTILLYMLVRKPSRYFLNPWKAFLWDGILGALPGYVLAWSLVYSLVVT